MGISVPSGMRAAGSISRTLNIDNTRRSTAVSFVQIIDMHTKNVDAIQNLEREWEKATEGKRTLRRSIVGRDRNDPDHYLVLAFFDSYESAMTNSNLPETNEFGQKQSALVDGAMLFIDLDVIDDRT
jgi:hypothetical protein